MGGPDVAGEEAADRSPATGSPSSKGATGHPSALIRRLSSEQAATTIQTLTDNIDSDDSDGDITELTTMLQRINSRNTSGGGAEVAIERADTESASKGSSAGEGARTEGNGVQVDGQGMERTAAWAEQQQQVAGLVGGAATETSAGIAGAGVRPQESPSTVPKMSESRRSSVDSLVSAGVQSSARGGDSRAASPAAAGSEGGGCVSTQVFVPGSSVPMSRVRASPVRSVGSPVPRKTPSPALSDSSRPRASPKISPQQGGPRTRAPLAWEATLRGANEKFQLSPTPASSRRPASPQTSSHATKSGTSRRASYDNIITRPGASSPTVSSSSRTSTGSPTSSVTRRGNKASNDSAMRRMQATTRFHMQLENIPQLPEILKNDPSSPKLEDPDSITDQMNKLREKIKLSDNALHALRDKHTRQVTELRAAQMEYEDLEKATKKGSTFSTTVTREGEVVKNDSERAMSELLMANMQSAIREKEVSLETLNAKSKSLRADLERLPAGSARGIQLKRELMMLDLQISELKSSIEKQKSMVEESRKGMQDWSTLTTSTKSTKTQEQSKKLLDTREKVLKQSDAVAELDRKIKDMIVENETMKIDLLKLEHKLAQATKSPTTSKQLARSATSEIVKVLKSNVSKAREKVTALTQEIAYSKAQSEALKAKMEEKELLISTQTLDVTAAASSSPPGSPRSGMPPGTLKRTQSRQSLIRGRDDAKLQLLIHQHELDKLGDSLMVEQHHLAALENLLLQHQLSPSLTHSSASHGGSQPSTKHIPSMRLS